MITPINESNDRIPVSIPNGDNIVVKDVESAQFPNDLDINNVLYIPDFKCNLLSVSIITRNLNCFVTFFPDF